MANPTYPHPRNYCRSCGAIHPKSNGRGRSNDGNTIIRFWKCLNCDNRWNTKEKIINYGGVNVNIKHFQNPNSAT